jgi:hypothetical protein
MPAHKGVSDGHGFLIAARPEDVRTYDPAVKVKVIGAIIASPPFADQNKFTKFLHDAQDYFLAEPRMSGAENRLRRSNSGCSLHWAFVIPWRRPKQALPAKSDNKKLRTPSVGDSLDP